MGKAGEEANKQLQKLRKDQKKLVKDIGVIFESEEFDEEQLTQWESFVTEVNSGIKSLKEKLQGMQQFVKKMSGGSSSSTAIVGLLDCGLQDWGIAGLGIAGLGMASLDWGIGGLQDWGIA
eukprot:12380361-Alexandrium_andersonii.AAC.1